MELAAYIYFLGALIGGIIYAGACLKFDKPIDYLAMIMSMVLWPKTVGIFLYIFIAWHLVKMVGTALLMIKKIKEWT